MNSLPMSAISAGCSHSMVVDVNGTVWGFGSNYEFELGFMDTSRTIPEMVPNLPEIGSVSCGAYTSLLLDCSGIVWVCGANDTGQLGVGDKIKSTPVPLENLPRIQAISAGKYHSLFLDVDGCVWVCGNACRIGMGSGGNSTKNKKSTADQSSGSRSFVQCCFG